MRKRCRRRRFGEQPLSESPGRATARPTRTGGRSPFVPSGSGRMFAGTAGAEQRARTAAVDGRCRSASGCTSRVAAGIACVIWPVKAPRALDRILSHSPVAGVITDRRANGGLDCARRAVQCEGAPWPQLGRRLHPQRPNCARSAALNARAASAGSRRRGWHSATMRGVSTSGGASQVSDGSMARSAASRPTQA